MAVELQPDIVVLGFSMPEMNGLQAARILRSLLPAASLFLLTAHSEDIGGTAEDFGLNGIFPKSGDFRSIVRKICAAPAKHRVAGSAN